MLVSVTFAHVVELCGKENFKRRRRQSLSVFFYPVPVSDVINWSA